MGNNEALAKALRQIATLLTEKGVDFKPAAYRKAAQVIEDLDRDVAEFGSKEALKALPGIGEAIASKTLEFLETGRIVLLDQLILETGGLAPELLKIEGLGPKRARVLQSELGVQSADDLKQAAKEHKIQALEGFDAIMEEKLLKNADRIEERSHRFPREEVTEDVEELLKHILDLPNVERAEVAGSYRREKPTVGDIDILVVTEDGQGVSDAISTLKLVRDVIAHGDKKLSFDLQSGLRTDVRFVDHDQFGSALLYFTGSKEWNIIMRKKAIARGWKLSEYGLFDGDEVIASKEEDDIFDALEMDWREPKDR